MLILDPKQVFITHVEVSDLIRTEAIFRKCLYILSLTSYSDGLYDTLTLEPIKEQWSLTIMREWNPHYHKS